MLRSNLIQHDNIYKIHILIIAYNLIIKTLDRIYNKTKNNIKVDFIKKRWWKIQKNVDADEKLLQE